VGDLLARYKLGSPSTHIPFANVRGDWARSLADARAIGHEYVTIPWLPEEERRTVDNWKRIAELFNRAGADAKAAGLRFAYHNHDFELRKIGNEVPLEVLLAETDPALVRFEMDIYWLVKAGADPLAYLARYPGRFTMVHAKDSLGPPDHRMVDVGAGTIDFRDILARATSAGLQHVFVEHDQPADAMKSVAASYAHLAQLDG
jgi:sugar phosphate isomerase/epimerase